MVKQESIEITKEQFIQLNCIDCKNDNDDNEPECKILIQILAGRKLNSLQCKKYKKRSWKHEN